MHICIYTHTYIHTHTYIYIYKLHVCIYIYYIYIYIHIFVCVWLPVWNCIYILNINIRITAETTNQKNISSDGSSLRSSSEDNCKWPVVWPPTVSTIAPWHRITDHNQSLCGATPHLNVPWIALTTSGVHMCSWLPWVANSIATANSSARSSPGFSHESTDLSILTDHHLQSWSTEKIGCNLKAHWKDGSWWKYIQKKCELKSSGLASVCNKMPAGCAGYSLARQIGVHGGQKVFRW